MASIIDISPLLDLQLGSFSRICPKKTEIGQHMLSEFTPGNGNLAKHFSIYS
jgi:hypothetical protein